MKRSFVTIFYIFSIIVLLIIMSIIFFATKWTTRINQKSIFLGDGYNCFENVLLNSINGLLSFYIPKENDTEFLDWEKMYPELKILEKNWEVIRDDAMKVRHKSPDYGNIDNKNKGLSFSDKKYWKVYILKYYQDYISQNCKNVKETCKLLKQIKKLNLAMFSILEKGKTLYPHRGPYRGILRVHLPLKIPKHKKTYLEVNKKKHYWKEGKIVAFDDTFTHSVKNPNHIQYADDRIILLIDLPRRDVPSAFNIVTSLASKYFNKINNKIEKKSQIHD